jgi:hypothetical protein
MEDRMTWTTKTRGRARAILPSLALLAGAGLAGCDDKNDILAVITPVQTVVVTTFKDPVFDFATLHTFSMPDTVIHFDPLTGTPLSVTRQFDATALQAVRQNLLARGYTEVTAGAGITPSFVVLVGATATENYNAFVGYSWFNVWGFYNGWAFYAPGFDNSWGIVYPWYPTSGVTAYARGTLVTTIIPTLTINPLAKNISAAWAGVATSLLNDGVTAAGVTAAVNQMFVQSPYLTATP